MTLKNFRAIDMPKNGIKTIASTKDRVPVDKRIAVPEPTSNPVPQAIDPDAVPSGTVPEVLTWVGEDKDRAAQALEVEEADEKPRKGLIKALNEVIDTEDDVSADEDDSDDES